MVRYDHHYSYLPISELIQKQHSLIKDAAVTAAAITKETNLRKDSLKKIHLQYTDTTPYAKTHTYWSNFFFRKIKVDIKHRLE